MDGSGHDGIAQQFDNPDGDVVVGNTDANGLFLALEEVGNRVGGVQYEGEWAWQCTPHHLESMIGNRF